MSVPHSAGLYATSLSVFCPLSQAEVFALEKASSLQKVWRTYQMEYLSKVLQIECPVLTNSVSGEPGVILSSVKLPFRRYPSHVYLFAMFLSLIGLSMRASSIRIQSLFGISKFSHSTISRCFRRLEKQVQQLAEWVTHEPQIESTTQIALQAISPASLQHALKGTTAAVFGDKFCSTFVHPRQWRCPRPLLYQTLHPFLSCLLPKPESGNNLLYVFWKRFGCLLL